MTTIVDSPPRVYQYVDVDKDDHLEYGISVNCDTGDYRNGIHLAIKALLDDTQKQVERIIKLGDAGTYCAICRQFGHSRNLCQAFCTPCKYGEFCKLGRGRCRFQHPPISMGYLNAHERANAVWLNDLGKESSLLEATCKGIPVTIHLPPKPLPQRELTAVRIRQRVKAGGSADERYYSA